MLELTIADLRRRIGSLEILKGISLELKPGEIVALLGHSGSGKTTLLRSVAGLDSPSSGTISLRDRPVFDGARGINVPPEARGLSLVFQSYALWPNKSVAENVGYGLKLRKASRADIDERVRSLLERLGLPGLGERYPHQLSGGQQQRVALARALAYQPNVLLLDEPLSNLDAKLREEARSWLRELIVQARISALYVTHDQIEAMAVADRILLLRGGAVEQEGTPAEIYDRPATLEAAKFMGTNNILDVGIEAVADGYARFSLGGAPMRGLLRADKAAGSPATAIVRVEKLKIADGPGENRFPARMVSNLYLGERHEHHLDVDGVRLRAWGDRARPEGTAYVEIDPQQVWLF